MNSRSSRNLGLIAAALIFLLPGLSSGQTTVEPGFNLFTEEQDIEIGRESAREVENQLPMLHDRTATQFLDRLGSRLAENTPGYDYPYQFQLVDVVDVNAFALPGGFMFVNRGLLALAPNEEQLAAVMAHEIAHVALRHGTHQASKAYLSSTGLSLLTGLIGGRTATDIVGAVGGFGLNALFLNFSREAEREADILGAQILARAGYDPLALVRMFDTLASASEGSGGSALPTFFSSHPPYDERQRIVHAEAAAIGDVTRRRPVSGLQHAQSTLEGLQPARSTDRYVSGDTGTGDARNDRQTDQLPDVRIEPTSSEWRTFHQAHDYFQVDVPDNWEIRETQGGFGVTFAPQGGTLQLADGREEIVYGVMIDHFEPEGERTYTRSWEQRFTTDRDWQEPERDSTRLERASQQLIQGLQASNAHLVVQSGSERSTRVDNQRAYLVTLEGDNAITGRKERVTVMTRETDGDGHLIYALMIAPEAQWSWMAETFDRMISSLRVNDTDAHRAVSER